MGSSVIERSKAFVSKILPLQSVMLLETMINVGVLNLIFLIEVEMDISVIKELVIKSLSQEISLFLGVAPSVTAFPLLARILAEMKLINTEIGRVAMSSALINDICAWILLAFAITLTENEAAFLASLQGIRYSCIGTHSILGAFVYGLVIPNVPLRVTLIEKLEDFCSTKCMYLKGLLLFSHELQRPCGNDCPKCWQGPEGEDAIEPDDSGMLTVETENKRGKWCDAEYVSEFRIQTAHDESRSYNEKAVNNDWSECLELGAIRDLLASCSDSFCSGGTTACYGARNTSCPCSTRGTVQQCADSE
ncbi:hypothetical protein DKX38_007328 [Salix brachista]|uniref:Cation/H+ exchanger transmembrane domain-containing protein n=1 Tax=Salix brachista TaxID=2182728 RepID=A0A5N5MMX4_9ROSI|nr:hypothetical protein DKX38_007328 [Salix brachista]